MTFKDWLIAAALIAFGAVLCGAGVHHVLKKLRDRDLRAHGTRVLARFDRFSCMHNMHSVPCTVGIRFESAPGHEVRLRIRMPHDRAYCPSGHDYYRPGATAPVYFDPSDPHTFALDPNRCTPGASLPTWTSVFWCLPGLAVVGLGVVGIWSGLARRSKKEPGGEDR